MGIVIHYGTCIQVDKLFALFLGSPSGAHEDAVVSPAAPTLRVRLMGLFNKSLTAANRFPATLQASMQAFGIFCAIKLVS